jgi:hypothetical protein
MRRASTWLGAVACVLLLAAAPAWADSVRVEAPAEVAVDQEYAVTLAVDTAHGDGRLAVLRRPASGPPCAAKQIEDPSPGDTANLTSYSIPVTAPGTFEVKDRIVDPGDYRICAWLNQGVIESYAVGEALVHARSLAGEVHVDRFWQAETSAAGAFLEAEVSGRSEGRVPLLAQVGSIHRPCPTDADSAPGALQLMPLRGDSDVGPGPFHVRLRSTVPVVHGAYRLCVAVWATPSLPEAAARDSATLSTHLAPVHSLRGGPRVRWDGRVLICEPGDWVGLPRPHLSVRWQYTIDAAHPWRSLPARGLRLRPRRWGDYRCVVTAANRFGRARDESDAAFVFRVR